MTPEEQDEIEFEEWWKVWGVGLNSIAKTIARCAWFASRKVLREREAREQMVLPDGCLLADTNGVIKKK